MKFQKADKRRNYGMTTNGDIKGLLKKMLLITKSIDSIPKNGENGEYQYVTENDVVSVLRLKLTEHNIMVIPNVVETSTREVTSNSGHKTSVVKVIMSYTFFDIETGGYIETYFQGEGEDVYDKGIYKAITGCQKYAFLKTFQIPTGGDPEEHSLPTHQNKINESVGEVNVSGSNIIAETKARQLYRIGKGKKEAIEMVLAKYGYKTTFEVQEKYFNEIARELKAI